MGIINRNRTKGARTQQNYRLTRTRVIGKLTAIPPPYIATYDTQVDTYNVYPYVDDRETIVDSVGYFNRFNGCSHTKNFIFTMPAFKGAKSNKFPPSTWLNTGWKTCSTDTGTFNGSRISFQGLYGASLPIPSMPAADWSSLVSQVGSQLDGRMTTGQNMLVSLAEIGKTIGMIKNPFSLKNAPKLLRQLSPGKALKSTAGAWLEFRYGWSNLRRDIEALASVWSEVRAHQEYLSQSVNTFVSSASRAEYKVSNPSLGIPGLGDTYYVHATPKIRLVKRIDTFSLDIKREAQALAWSKLDQVMARLGVNDILEALWDLVPLSFVVDWFTHTNRLLQRRSIDWHAYDLRKIGYSQKWEWYGYVNYISRAYNYDSSLVSVTGSTGDQLVQTKYQRSGGFPPATATVGLFGSLTKTQIADGVALIVQRI